jgi:UDP-glucose 4-epimerase
LRVYADGEQSRDFTFIQNVVHANLLASEADAGNVSGKVFNVATGCRITLNQAGQVLREVTGYSGDIHHAVDRVGDVKHSLAVIGQARECFGYEPLINFREGIERTVTWYRAIANSARSDN